MRDNVPGEQFSSSDPSAQSFLSSHLHLTGIQWRLPQRKPWHSLVVILSETQFKIYLHLIKFVCNTHVILSGLKVLGAF